MILKGKVKTGLGEASFWVKKIKNIFYKKFNIILFPGTLNISLENNYNIKDEYFSIHKEEYGGTQELYIKRCKILGHNAFIIRTEKNSSKNR